MSWFWFFLVIVLFQLVLVIFMQLSVLSLKNQKRSIKKLFISVIIPFHNEEERISKLLTSLKKQLYTDNIQLIFIDDHSTDATARRIVDQLSEPHEIYKNCQKKGKKWAIREGVLRAKHDIILTLDADVTLPDNYFELIQFLVPNDLVILPVRSNSHSLIGKMADLEFRIVQLFTFASAKWQKPMLCNGANLMFKKSIFNEVDQQRSDYSIPSGDDMFLLREVTKIKGTIGAYSEMSLAVSVESPDGIVALLSQRKRWLSKLKYGVNAPQFFAALLLLVLEITFYISLSASFIYPAYLWILLIKLSAEIVAVNASFKKDATPILQVVLFQFFYPLYLVMLCFKWPREKRWK
jgi:biofilm PGA synthesis N-glycosyltransferase PgaC